MIKHMATLSKITRGFAEYLQRELIAGQYAAANGLLQKIDPRVKLVFSIFSIALLTLNTSFEFYFFAFLLIILLAVLSKLRISFFLKNTIFPIPFFTLLIFLPILFAEPVSDSRVILMTTVLGNTLEVYEANLAFVVLSFIRVFLSVAFLYIIHITTKWDDLISAVSSLKMPRIVTMTLNLTYRYILHFLNLINNLFLFRESRIIGKFSIKQTLKQDAALLGLLLIRGFEKGESVYMGMQSRTFVNDFSLKIRKFKVGLIDILFIVISISYLLFTAVLH